MLVAYNLWLSDAQVAGGPGESDGPQGQIELARSIARSIRGPSVRALGLRVGPYVQVSINLIDPFHIGPVQVYDGVAALAAKSGAGIEHAELVGLVPMRVLADVPTHRLAELGLDEQHSIEARLEARTT